MVVRGGSGGARSGTVEAALDDVFAIIARGARPSTAADVPGWREREGGTQARSREDNEARARASGPGDGGMTSFGCECGDEGCPCAIRLTLAEYESVRAYATRFVIAPDHENPESEQVIEEHERFAVVDAVSGEAVRLARRSNPRQWRPTLAKGGAS